MNNHAMLDRNIEICHKFLNGLTMQAIGNEFKMTYRGIGMILAKNNIDRKDGGCAKSTKEKIANRLKIKTKKCFSKYGCSLNQYKNIVDLGLTKLYIHQVTSAKFRCIEWDFNLWGWYLVWLDSGKLEFRGKKDRSICYG